jgi:hypothetical protein
MAPARAFHYEEQKENEAKQRDSLNDSFDNSTNAENTDPLVRTLNSSAYRLGGVLE